MIRGDPGAVEVAVEGRGDHVHVQSLAALGLERNGRETIVLDLNALATKLDPTLIRELSLSRCGLNYLPDTLADLQLKALDLSHNRFECVPRCLLQGLRLIEDLNLAHNRLCYFDAEPRCVLKLRTLRLSNNYLENVPAWFLAMACLNLEEFYYSHNKITSLNESRFHAQSSYRLQKIEMRNCLMRFEDLRYLKNVRSLKVLDIGNELGTSKNCFVDKEYFAQLFSDPLWKNYLTVLCMNDLEMAVLPEDIGGFISLEELYVSQNYIYWLPRSLASLKKLRVLDMSHNHLVCFPEDIDALTKLEVLKLSHNGISSIANLRAMNLKELDLYDNYIDVACDIQINANVLIKLDLEQNFFDTTQLNLPNYEEKRNLLRLEQQCSRCNGPKVAAEEILDKNSVSDDSDLEYNWDTTGQVVREVEEESWSPVPGCFDDGCTSSDNEWTGSEYVSITSKKTSSFLQTDNDWLFEDH